LLGLPIAIRSIHSWSREEVILLTIINTIRNLLRGRFNWVKVIVLMEIIADGLRGQVKLIEKETNKGSEGAQHSLSGVN